MKEASRILKAGTGWIQCGEFDHRYRCDDGSVPDTADIWKYEACVSQILGNLGRDVFKSGEHLEKTISDAGFADVKVRRIKVPMGEWGGGP